jgi:hypothetical protein
MSFEARSAILHEIGAELQAGVLAYVTGDRENLETEVTQDVLRRVPRHLEEIGKQDRLALVLCTLGGDTNTPWPFVNFLRAYCDELFVLVPFWARSAGTLIALGADKIDVLAFFQLASEQGGSDAALADDAFRRLAESVHPLAIGNVKRNIEQIWQLAKKLIRLHTPDVEDEALTALVRRLTTELYSHSHMITRAEAMELGLPVEQPPAGVEDRLLAYYDQLKSDLELLEKFDPDAVVQQHPRVVLERGYVETPTTCDSFVTRGAIAQGPEATFAVASERWETIA